MDCMSLQYYHFELSANIYKYPHSTCRSDSDDSIVKRQKQNNREDKYCEIVSTSFVVGSSLEFLVRSVAERQLMKNELKIISSYFAC